MTTPTAISVRPINGDYCVYRCDHQKEVEQSIAIPQRITEYNTFSVPSAKTTETTLDRLKGICKSPLREPEDPPKFCRIEVGS